MATAPLSFSGTNLSRSSTSLARSAYHKHTTFTTGVAQNLSYLDSIHSDIETHLKKVIPTRAPISVFEPMRHLTFAPPKTTASALCVAACELVGGKREDAIVAASAIHLMHAAIYTHHHLMLTDRVQSEPETETELEIPHRFGPNIELLTGDGILPFGFELLAGSMDLAGDNSDKILSVIIEIARAVGSQGMVQESEVESDQSSDVTQRRLHGCGAACGAILGGGSHEEIERLRRYGVYAGKIEGLKSEIDRNEGSKMGIIEKWRALAIKELDHFDCTRIEQICDLLTPHSVNIPY